MKLLRLQAFLASPPETRKETIAIYETIYRNVDDDGIRAEVKELLDLFKQELLWLMQ